MATSLPAEKVRQAVAVLNEKNVDLWLTFVRETSLTPDPALDLILGMDLVWPSAMLVARDGTSIAIVGRFDAENIRVTGAYGEIVGYDQDVRAPLRAAVERLDPRSIALNYSENDSAADGLTHGLYTLLQQYFAATPYPARFVSAEGIVAAVRGRKTALEVDRLRAAVATTNEIFAEVGAYIQPGRSEREIADFTHARARERGLGTAWDYAYCPAVNAGPDSPVGHGGPTELRVQRGHLLHMDFGVRQDGYCSDLQRLWYLRTPGESGVPDDLQHAFDAVRAAIEAGRAALVPGTQGWQVDEAARATLVAAGYAEYLHATGHGLGRTAHDGATTLGPRWARYGNTPYGVVEAGNVFTLELGVLVPGRGYAGLEEDVVVTPQGAEYLGAPQTQMVCL